MFNHSHAGLSNGISADKSHAIFASVGAYLWLVYDRPKRVVIDKTQERPCDAYGSIFPVMARSLTFSLIPESAVRSTNRISAPRAGPIQC